MISVHPQFQLIEADIYVDINAQPYPSCVIDVEQIGVRGLIRALGGPQLDLYLHRDTYMPLPEDKKAALWLQTSGTTGKPKWVAHDISDLWDRLDVGKAQARWFLTYHPLSFAGLQVILSALKGPHTLIVPPPNPNVNQMVEQVISHQVTHMSGTPTFWRAFLMALGARDVPLLSITLGGEAVDGFILAALRARFPNAAIRHIYASTETGVVLSVKDGLPGFSAQLLGDNLKLSEAGTLIVDGIDTGDRAEIIDDRVYFQGRLDDLVNIGGVKVFPAQIEAHLQALGFVRDAWVKARPSPITGEILLADVILDPDTDDNRMAVKAHMLSLPRAARPAKLNFVDRLDVALGGKKARHERSEPLRLHVRSEPL
jgi:acyl-coenzyme A synthetase/AMP-(fatty) acid ligase